MLRNIIERIENQFCCRFVTDWLFKMEALRYNLSTLFLLHKVFLMYITAFIV